MENILRKPYEISLWDDDLVFKVVYYKNGKEHATKEYLGSLEKFESIEGTTTEVFQYYKERKICIIGSNTMDTPVRATAGKLVSNVNGSNTLTFNMYSRYYDEDDGQFYDNPFLKLLVNERKVKLRYGALGSEECKWYDFIIKDVKENSENKTFSYTCKDLFINELSKSGFSIQLDPELENNMGNIITLANTILEESDWQVGNDNDTISQSKEEPLYKITLFSEIVARDMKNQSAQIRIGPGKEIYGFYSILSNKEPYFQFLYREDGAYKVDDDRVIMNSLNYYIENVEYYDDGLPKFASIMSLSSDYRGEKLVRQALTKFDPTIDKYVNVYKKDGVEYYGYTTPEYITPTAVQTYITNGESFTSDSGWEVGAYWKDGNSSDPVYPDLDQIGIPDPRDISLEELANLENYRSFLRFKRTNTDQLLFNSGFADHRSAIKSLALGEKFVLRAKISKSNGENSSGRPTGVSEWKFTGANTQIDVVIAEYTLDKGKYVIDNDKIYFEGTFSNGSDGWSYVSNGTIQSKVSKSYSDLINARIGIFFKTPANKNVYFENIQFYRYVEYDKLKEGSETEYETVVAEPGGELFSAARIKYIYYLPNKNYKSIDDVIPDYDDYVDNPAYVKQYNDNQFEKIRSITASESNRFNMIQDLCETFECWARFEIEHNQQTGEILLDENYRQKKWITFHEYIGKDNYAGFRYGINLKSISRTLNSDGIVSKIVVKNNANEFAPNGFCSIARAPENPTGENFILNFDYYIQQGLIDFSEVNNDLYLDTNGYIGYYKKLKRLNADREAQISKQTQLKLDISQYSANYQTYKVSVDTAQELLSKAQQSVYDLTGFYLADLKRIHDKPENQRTEDEKKGYDWWDTDRLVVKVNEIAQLNSTIRQHTQLRDLEYVFDEKDVPCGGRLYQAEQEYAAIESYLKTLTDQKKALNLQFYKKYSRFIQEGSWISEDYTDENLYYLDAESTLYTSAQPKVTYTINVLELSQLEGYENYRFSLGDKTYIEDTEFFGWVWSKNGIKTPYHEEIVISEFTVELDSPDKNTFKVQNFKTQFEDLFQRITATTQSVEFHTGEYSRASSVVQADGTISIESLQNSIVNNAIYLQNSKDQSVVWDETGITTTSLSNPSEIVRMVSGGIFLSNDGGVTWKTGITGTGVNASYITSGQINTDAVHIMNGAFPSFRWDGIGISAYAFSVDANGKACGFNSSKFVRYDQFGLYGINGYSNFDPNKIEDGKSGEEKIWDKAQFALTWKGFLLRNKYGSGYVSIDSINDFVVNDGERNRIKIGNLGSVNSPLYGIRISDASGVTVMETADDGTLWLRNHLYIGTSKTSNVGIGYLEQVREGTDIHEVIHAGDYETEFIVYEDGKMVAQGAEFHGTIYATGGQIGNMTIGEVESGIESTKDIEIVADHGTTFQIDANNEVYPSNLDFRMVEKNVSIASTSDILWEMSPSFEEDSWTTIVHDIQVSIPYNDITFFNNSCYVRLTATDKEGKKYSKFITIHRIFDGKHPTILTITSTTGGIYINGEIKAQLRATAWCNGVDVTSKYNNQAFVWTKYDKNGSKDLTWKDFGPVIEIDHTEVEQKATFSCELIQE